MDDGRWTIGGSYGTPPDRVLSSSIVYRPSSSPGASMDNGALIQDRLSEYRTLLAPLARAEEDIGFSRRMLHARFEDEICTLAPALGALAEMLRVSALDM